MKTITKLDLTEHLKRKFCISSDLSSDLIENTFLSIIEALDNGESVNIYNFGVFSTLNKSARTGFDIRRRKHVVIEPRRVVKYKASSNLVLSLNKQANLID